MSAWLLLVGMAVFYIVGPYLIRRRRARRTTCVLTDRRALTITERRTRMVNAVFLKDVPFLNKRIRDDGSGSIAFGNVRSWALVSGEMAFGWHPSGSAATVVFSEIAGAETVALTAERLRLAKLTAETAG